MFSHADIERQGAPRAEPCSLLQMGIQAGNLVLTEMIFLVINGQKVKSIQKINLLNFFLFQKQSVKIPESELAGIWTASLTNGAAESA